MSTPIPLESNFQSTRLGVDFQTTRNLFRHSVRGYRQFPGRVEFTSFLAASEALTDSNGDAITDSNGDPVTVSVTPGGVDRGFFENGPNGLAYQVTGEALYSIDSSGNSTYLGVIANDPVPVVMASNGTQLIITTGGTPSAYVYTTASGLLAITDGDLGTAYSVAYLDSRFIYDQPDGFWAVSDLNDGSSIDALNFANAEAFSDDTLRVFPQNQLLYIFGATSTEIWYTSGVGRPPLDRQSVLKHGIAGRYCVNSIDDTIYFIDAKKRPSVLNGTQYQPMVISSALGAEWVNYADFSNVRVQCYSLQQENFVDFIFPDNSKVWTYHEPSGEWTEKTFNSTSVVRAFNRTLSVGFSDKKIYALDFDTFTNDGTSIERTKDIYITSELVGAPGVQMQVSCLRLTVDCSASTDFTLSISKELGAFTTINTKSFNGTGTLEFRALGKFREAVLRITTSSDSKASIVSAAIDAKLMSS